MKQTVLFLCYHNAARSQMAEGLLRSLYPDRYEAFSAGVKPTQVHIYAIQVMKEIGIDISHQRSKSIEEYRGRMFDYAVTVCDQTKQSCPFFPGKTVLHRGFVDPVDNMGSQEEMLAGFRRIRDELKVWIVETFGQTKQPQNSPSISFQ
jgi:arsenate reductase